MLEQHELIGSETSSRNSEVIHAGIYYPPGSLRATLCVRGKELLYAFCAENRVPHARCGKLLVATHESQLPKLAAIKETAAKNGVTDLEPIGGNAARALEPELACVAALLSPSTGIIDSHGFMLALEGHVEARRRLGGAALSGRAHRARRGRPVPPDDRRRQPRRHHLQAPGQLGGAARLQARAHARPTATATRRPRPTTPRASTTRCRAARRSSATSIRCPTAPGSACTPPSTSADAASSAPTSSGSPTSTTASSRRSSAKFLDFIRSYYPGLEVERLHPDYTGIRPKLYREGEPVPDFAIHGPATARAGRASSPSTASRARPDGVAGHRRGGGGDAERRAGRAYSGARARGRSGAGWCGRPGP